ncbi:metal-dependent hydrolase [Paenibacillus lycopersici]|uniref:Metal-dependent hydrolase n=1 Tax=Paenibacillus lycopersici TaxID=2704462 RepID=A0A6C0G1B7_9BACL|nr:metal-dependent hydrolase [Paenibacillus lycopersici]QHT61673.1 metal-dependent hydrolase [Paenibacillus lycopersici]
MDTGSHLLFGATLAGLALADPAVAAHAELQHAVLAAALLGSHAPDFDSVMRLRGPYAYIRNHRGITHSLPAPLVWAPLLGLPIAWLFGAQAWSGTVMLWTFIAVCFHIILDLFNAYGVQCLRPFTRKWLHLDALCLFDPYLFAAHGMAVLLWLFDYSRATAVFEFVYAMTGAYLLWRLVVHRKVLAKLCAYYRTEASQVTMLPTFLGTAWQFVIDRGDEYMTGYYQFGRVNEAAYLPKAKPDSLTEAAKATMASEGVRAFHRFSDRIHVNVQDLVDGYLVTWSDVRFWHHRRMPFSAAVTLDRNLNVLSDRLAWNKKSWEPPFV